MTAIPPVRPPSVLPGSLAPLGYRNFLLYWIGHATSKLGRSIEDMGAVWLVYELTASPFALGLLGLARAVPAIALGPLAGVVADRMDQRRLLFTTQSLWLLSSLGLGMLALSGYVQFWHVYVLIALKAIATTFDGAVREALFPRLVPRELIGQAVTLSASAGRAAAVVGPLIGGLAIAYSGEAAPFLLTAATFPVLMSAVVLMRGVVPRTAAAGSTLRGELVEGLRYILQAPVLSGILSLQVVFEVFQMNAVMVTLIGRERLSVGPEGLGGLLSAPAVGALIAIVALLIVGHPRRQGRFAILSTVGYAATLAGFAVSDQYVVSYLLLVGIGALDSFLTVNRHNVMQLAAPGRMRGRIMGNMGTITRGLSPLSETQSGALAGLVGAPLAVAVAAAALAVTGLATARANPALWRFTRDELAEEPPAAFADRPAPEHARPE